MIVHDGHVHSLYCPHGTSDTFAAYCEEAIKLGLKGLTFTEHAPLPASFIDPTPSQDSAMSLADLLPYFNDVYMVKKEFRNHLNVLLGLEVDYIRGFEKETRSFLNEYGPMLDDSILSVHFLQINHQYYCIDYSPDVFAQCANTLGSVNHLHTLYYNTVRESIVADLGNYKPTRIGHITLSSKFKKKYPASKSHRRELKEILYLIKGKGYSLDYNGAGTIKPLCQETYPPQAIAKEAATIGIPLIYGSDAHQVKGMSSGVESILQVSGLTTPKTLS